MFSYLYVQTEYSILQSACKINDLVQKLKQLQITSCAITDEGTMYGTIRFYKACKKEGIHPIIGLKVNYTYNDRESSLLLYAINDFGYKNLMKISSRCKLAGGIIDFEYLQKATMGILAIVPFEESILKRYLDRNAIQDALSTMQLLCATYDICFVGLGPETIQNTHMQFIYDVLNGRHYSMVALPKVSFIEQDDYGAYITLKSIRNNGRLVQLPPVEKTHYMYTQLELSKIYADYPHLLEETNRLAHMCQVDIVFGKYQLPLYQEGLDSFRYLKELCQKGLDKRISQFQYPYHLNTYYERLFYELNVIQKMGFCDYFLIVYDYVKFAKKNHIYVGPGRGSAPASLVAYTLGITDIDPIYHRLLFERFLNQERISMPDIDIDFPDDRRDEVIRYVGEKYGKEKVAHILTFGTFRMKLAINDCARVYQLSDIKLKQIYKIIADKVKIKPYENVSLKEVIANDDELTMLMADHEDIDRVLSIASKIQDIPRNISTHAAGIVITRFDLVNYTPLDEGLDGIYQTQYEAEDLEALGLLKMDFLGLKNLTNIAKTVSLIQKDISNFTLPKDENDRATYQMMASGDLTGVFQLESAGMRKLIMQLQTSHFNDITQALALYRPGPMEIIPTFIKRKFGQEQVSYPHPDLKSILDETYGMIVYQDQIMLIACQFAGYSLGRADILRRAVSKKKKEVLEEERLNFVQSSVQHGYTKEDAHMIYDYIVKFADYGFNKAHSVAYAKVAYLTAYLKCHYFAYYMSTLLTSFMSSTTEVLEYTKEAIRKKVNIQPPHINASQDEFSVIDGAIYFPLTIIRGLGEMKTKQCLEERKKGLFTSFENFLMRTKHIFASSIIENIIYSGALDCFGLTKKAMIEGYQAIIDKSEYHFIKDMLEGSYTNEEFAYGLLQTKELEVLGINLVYNFFRQFASFYTQYHLQKIIQIKENQLAHTIGIVKKIKEIKTKQNEIMAFIELMDDESSIELVFFPRVYQEARPLTTGNILMVSGTPQRRVTLQVVVSHIKKI
ncbi:MAG: DNA polymerase III subunit alpha [Anaeroplasma bactoclasticum]|nr:DNA polymerase III subunit alpha [Anaeroplasma bactoclasticum]